MTQRPQCPYTPEDIWGARCGLLHTHTASSKLSRQGKARQLHYYTANGPITPDVQRDFDMQAIKGKIFVDVWVLYTDWLKAVGRFVDHISHDQELRDRVSHHSRTLLGSWRVAT